MVTVILCNCVELYSKKVCIDVTVKNIKRGRKMSKFAQKVDGRSFIKVCYKMEEE